MELAYTLPLYTALLVLVGLTRLVELLLSRRNRRLLRATGATAVREPHFRAMVLLHVCILVGAGVEAWITRRAPVRGLAWAMLALLLAASALRWWVIATLGSHWNVAIMDSIAEPTRRSDGVAAVSRGPYRWIRHPNYLAVFLELLALPLVHAAWLSAAFGSTAHVWVLRHRVRSEEAVLLGHPSYQAVMADKPRFIPRPLSAAVQSFFAFVRLGRPLFLMGGFLLYGLGGAVAVAQGRTIDPSVYLLGQVVFTAFHLMTHYANDYLLTREELPRWVALAGALALAAGGIATAIVLASRHPAPLLIPTAMAILVLSWLYSAPPLRLHSTGLGELDVALVVTTLGPFFAFYLQVPDLVGLRTLLLAILPLCCLQFAMILAVEVPDAIGDSMVGKRTLVVRLGRPRAVRWYATVVFIAYAALPILVAAGLPMAVALATALFAPLATWRIWSVRGGRALRPESWEGLTFWAAALFVLTAAAELAGFLLM
jgi:isoprenylcysteine carboxyl methyltransferase (ICMT) family protein YpbQ/1,4-dihydroxy-2-naphthoate octaprenyltransferase